MQHVTLNNGVKMPVLGFGVFQIDPSDTRRVVMDALEAGYRSFDTAVAYGNEKELGAALSDSGIPREELFITTKLWIDDARPDRAQQAVERSLENLGLDRLDLHLIHQPFGDYYSAWRTMEEQHADGLLRAIGVSNFDPVRLLDLIVHSDTVPAVNQIEAHPFHQRRQDQQFMRGRGVRVEAWSPLAEGTGNLFRDPALTAIAQAHGRTVAQVVLRWLIERGIVVIPKSVRPERMRENISVFDFELTPADHASIAALDTETPRFDHRDPRRVEELFGLPSTGEEDDTAPRTGAGIDEGEPQK